MLLVERATGDGGGEGGDEGGDLVSGVAGGGIGDGIGDGRGRAGGVGDDRDGCCGRERRCGDDGPVTSPSPQLAWRRLGVGACVASPVTRVAGRNEQAQPGGGTAAVCPAAARGYSSLCMHAHTMAPCGRVRT